jgi:hypothetical protein
MASFPSRFHRLHRRLRTATPEPGRRPLLGTCRSRRTPEAPTRDSRNEPGRNPSSVEGVESAKSRQSLGGHDLNLWIGHPLEGATYLPR